MRNGTDETHLRCDAQRGAQRFQLGALRAVTNDDERQRGTPARSRQHLRKGPQQQIDAVLRRQRLHGADDDAFVDLRLRRETFGVDAERCHLDRADVRHQTAHLPCHRLAGRCHRIGLAQVAAQQPALESTLIRKVVDIAAPDRQQPGSEAAPCRRGAVAAGVVRAEQVGPHLAQQPSQRGHISKVACCSLVRQAHDPHADRRSPRPFVMLGRQHQLNATLVQRLHPALGMDHAGRREHQQLAVRSLVDAQLRTHSRPAITASKSSRVTRSMVRARRTRRRRNALNSPGDQLPLRHSSTAT